MTTLFLPSPCQPERKRRQTACANDGGDEKRDLMEIVRALTDSVGRREEVDAAQLAERIEGAVLGYLDARRRIAQRLL
jgi:hypothetical protein